MRIGVDIDGVLTDESSFMKDYGSKFYYKRNILTNIDLNHYDSKETFGISEEKYMEFWKEYLEFYALNCPPRPFAAEVLKRLKQKGCKIYIITSRSLTDENTERGTKMRKLVLSWLNKHDIEYDEIFFVTDKVPICKRLELDYMIDDKPENIIDISKITKVICYHDFCNANVKAGNVTRCFSWYDILAKLEL